MPDSEDGTEDGTTDGTTEGWRTASPAALGLRPESPFDLRARALNGLGTLASVQGEDYIMLRERDLHAVAAQRIEGSTGLYL